MPSLNRYANSNKKTGYYIRANVGGSHPVTLQTTQVSEKILRENGYKNGSTIPTKLVWGLYDVDLLYTESSTSGSIPSYSVEESLIPWLNSSKLTEKTRREIINYLSSYSGLQQDAINQLLEELRKTSGTSRDTPRPSRDGRTNSSNTSHSSRKTKRKTRTRSTESDSLKPWQQRCPLCQEKVYSTDSGLITHWALSSTCEFSKDEPIKIKTIGLGWESIVQKVEAERRSRRSAEATETKSATEESLEPWEQRCPLCQEKVYSTDSGLTLHWANSSTCSFSKDEPREISAIDSDWDSIVEEVERKRKPYPECPYCDFEFRNPDAVTYINHWIDGSCSKRIESLPESRPTVVPAKIWHNVEKEWPEGGEWPEEKTWSELSHKIIGGAILSVRDRLL